MDLISFSRQANIQLKQAFSLKPPSSLLKKLTLDQVLNESYIQTNLFNLYFKMHEFLGSQRLPIFNDKNPSQVHRNKER